MRRSDLGEFEEIVLLAVAVSSCGTSRAFRRGEVFARAGDWDNAVAYYTRAVQADLERLRLSPEAAYVFVAVALQPDGDDVFPVERKGVAHRHAARPDTAAAPAFKAKWLSGRQRQSRRRKRAAEAR